MALGQNLGEYFRGRLHICLSFRLSNPLRLLDYYCLAFKLLLIVENAANSHQVSSITLMILFQGKSFQPDCINNFLASMFFFILGESPETKTWFLDPRKEEKLIHRIQQQSCRAFRELGLQDFGLFDFRVDIEGNPFLLECNLFCSFGPQSVVNTVAKDSGFTDESLFDMMVENTLLRKRKQENNNVNL